MFFFTFFLVNGVSRTLIKAVQKKRGAGEVTYVDNYSRVADYYYYF